MTEIEEAVLPIWCSGDLRLEYDAEGHTVKAYVSDGETSFLLGSPSDVIALVRKMYAAAKSMMDRNGGIRILHVCGEVWLFLLYDERAMQYSGKFYRNYEVEVKVPEYREIPFMTSDTTYRTEQDRVDIHEGILLTMLAELESWCKRVNKQLSRNPSVDT